MNPTNSKRLETSIYAALWLIAIVLFMLDIMRWRSYLNLPLIDAEALCRLFTKLLPFVALFSLNNYILIPKLLKRAKYTQYFIAVIFSIGVVWLWQKYQFATIPGYEAGGEHHRPPHHPGPHPLMPLPIFLDVIYDILIIGVNLAIALLFQHFADRIKHESLMKENAENQLDYLKAQINPHFYMNMLNNIHGMIEIDSEKAQDMVIEMSRLMRYMLYDSSHSTIELSAEVTFIKDYLALMRVRYPIDLVSIHTVFPETKRMAGVHIPPLLFIVFIENAFKHGISYAEKSFVSISLAIEKEDIVFSCMNSNHPTQDSNPSEGIGLENVKRRLDLIYHDRYYLEIEKTDTAYSVNLTLPPYETKDIDN